MTNLKQELENIRKDEEYRRKHVYDVLLDKTLKYNDIVKSTKLSPGNDFNFLNEDNRSDLNSNFDANSNNFEKENNKSINKLNA